ncbi:MAG: hypothetical protein JXR49_04660 [Acidobacteria bacterium]|nr:hypothetical protein [Acidobacteriota bacterium]
MTRKQSFIIFAVILFVWILLPIARANTEFFDINDLKPGMKGVGKTCFRGDRPEEFQVEILGVLRGFEAGADAVLARLSGEMLDETGVFEGMSGSPVFIDGKLLGAVAFTYSYAKEAICGITPITQMVDSFKESPTPEIEFHLDTQIDVFSKATISSPGIRNLSTGHAIFRGDGETQLMPESLQSHALVPIATPLSLGGFDAKTLQLFQPKFRVMGLSILQGVGGMRPEDSSGFMADPDTTALEPGSNIIIPLIRGDLEVSAGGTVTYIDGDKLYAFGHSLLELGFTDLPVHKARTMFIFPSLQSSFKILEMGEAVGSIRQDRGMGIFGRLGETTRMIPLKVRIKTSRRLYKTFEYEMVQDRLLTPLLVNLAVYNSIAISERGQGVLTIDVQGKVRVKNEEAVEVYNRFSSDSGVADAISVSAALPVNYLLAFGYKNLDIEDIDLTITVQESDRSALLDSIRLNRTEAKAGDSLELEISCKKANGDTIQNVYPLQIPSNITPGPLHLLVADGTTLMSMDEQPEDEILVPRNLSHLIRLINNLRKNDHLYIRMFRRETGAVVKGEGLPGLPPSILSILGSERKVGAIIPIGISSLQEYELPRTNYLAAGWKMLTIRINP